MSKSIGEIIANVLFVTVFVLIGGSVVVGIFHLAEYAHYNRLKQKAEVIRKLTGVELTPEEANLVEITTGGIQAK